MTDVVQSRMKAPWHLWVVGVVSLLWNAMGAVDFTMTQLNSEAYLAAYTPGQRAYFDGIPLWADIAWGTATWSALIGSVLLLLRSAQAIRIFLVSIAAMIVTAIHNFALSNGLEIMGGGTGMLIFTGVIWLVAFLLFYYAWTMTRRGVLR